jgi:hypothetical protein
VGRADRLNIGSVHAIVMPISTSNPNTAPAFSAGVLLDSASVIGRAIRHSAPKSALITVRVARAQPRPPNAWTAQVM